MRRIRSLSRKNYPWFIVMILALTLGGLRWQLAANDASTKVATQVLGAQVVQANGKADSAASGSSKANGAANGKGDDPKGSFTASGQVQGLFPGAVVALPLTLANPQSFGIVVNQVTVTVQTAVLPAPPLPGVRLTPACTTGAVEVGVLDNQGQFRAQNPILVSVPLGKNGTAQLTTVHLHMVASPPDACQGSSFGLSYGGSAVKS
jgi:hypothetical protein